MSCKTYDADLTISRGKELFVPRTSADCTLSGLGELDVKGGARSLRHGTLSIRPHSNVEVVIAGHVLGRIGKSVSVSVVPQPGADVNKTLSADSIIPHANAVRAMLMPR